MPIEGGYEQKVDEALREWQQGDVILGERLPFLLLADLAKPLSPTTRREASSGVADSPSSRRAKNSPRIRSIGGANPGWKEPWSSK